MDTTTYQEQLNAQRAEREALWRLEWEWAEAHVAARQRRGRAARARSARRWADETAREAQAERRAQLRVVPGGRSE